MITNSNGLIPSLTVVKWRVGMDYCKLNAATKNDHFPLQFTLCEDPFLYKLGLDKVKANACLRKKYKLSWVNVVTPFWITFWRKDAREYSMNCDRCQCTGNISTKDETPTNFIMELEMFDVLDIDFGLILIFSWPSVHSSCSGLCLQMGWGNLMR